LLLLAILLAPAFAQTESVYLVSDKPGRAEARVGGAVLHADEATLNQETGELQMRGHVHVILPAREDHTVVRYSGRVMLTDQPIGLTADRLSVKNGVLGASGSIVIVPADEKLPKVQLRGDDLTMDLKIADATVRGNVRTVGLDEPAGSQKPPARFIFPPDIIRQ